MAIESIGKIRYIEPTNISENGKDATGGNTYIAPLEDYCISIDLEIFYSKRSSCGIDKPIRLFFSTDNKTLSLLNGTSGHLTTNFTDISYDNPENNTSECVGIESINISYEMSTPAFAFSPIVKIKFIDVRGASFMAKKESNSDSINLLESLFIYPYPQFNLYVKGFYGRKVKYSLTLSKSTGIEFDSQTGNFSITGEFIGSMYGIYNDIPMQYAAISPYMDYFGKSYWNEQIQKGIFVLDNGGDNADMITFSEFRNRISNASSSQPYKDIESSYNENITYMKNKKQAINDLIISFPLSYWNSIKANEYIYYNINTENNDKYIADELLKISDFLDKVKNFDKEYGNNLYSYFSFFEKYKKNEDKIYFINIEKKDGDFISIGGNFSQNDAALDFMKSLIINEMNKFHYSNYFTLYIIMSDTEIGSINPLNNMVLECDNKINEIEKNFLTSKNQFLTNILGFPPTIKNIFKLVFAHIDTFMHVFYECISNIKRKIENNSIERTFDYFGIDISSTDNNNTKYLFPFTLVTTEIKEEGQTYNEMMWPGELTNGNSMDEVQFVNSLLSASKLYFKNSQEQLNNMDYNGESALSSNEIKLSIYNILKNIYDRWASFSIGEKWKLVKNGSTNTDCDFYRFYFIDSFYNNIGDILLVDVQKVSNILNNFIASSSLDSQNMQNFQAFGFLFEISSSCGGNLMALPLMYGIDDNKALKDIFSVISYNEAPNDDLSAYVFLYTYKNSENLNIGIGNKDDGFMIKSSTDLLPSSLMDNGNGTIPAFGVTFAKQNQAFFKKLSLKSENANETVNSISKTMEIASEVSEGPRETSFYGQNIYEIYSSRQYKCEVTMMGDAQIMPLMYFQLNNVPFWKGTYMIISVSHEIVAGNMTTTFTGIRVNRYTLPIYDGRTEILKEIGGEVPIALKGFSNNTNDYTSLYYPYSDIIKISNKDDYELAKEMQLKIQKELGWDDYMAAALIGCIYAESGGLRPSSVNIGEKGGILKTSLACYNPQKINSEYNYGAGIIQWTFMDRKLKGLNYIAQKNQGKVHGQTPLDFLKDCDPTKPTTPLNGKYKGGIENLALSEQIDIIIGEIEGEYKNIDKSMRQCKTIEESVAVIFCDYLGGYPSKIRIPTPLDVEKKVERYMKANNTTDDRLFYKKRLGYAKNFI